MMEDGFIGGNYWCKDAFGLNQCLLGQGRKGQQGRKGNIQFACVRLRRDKHPMMEEEARGVARAGESGVALRLPPQSKIAGGRAAGAGLTVRGCRVGIRIFTRLIMAEGLDIGGPSWDIDKHGWGRGLTRSRGGRGGAQRGQGRDTNFTKGARVGAA